MKQYDTNTAQYSSMSEKKAVKWQALYSLTDDNVVIAPMKGQCSILHQFVGRHVSLEHGHRWTCQHQRTKNGHFPNHKFPWNKISGLRKMGEMDHFTNHAHMYILLIHIQNTAHAVLKLSLCRAPAEPGMSPSFWPYYEEVLCTCIGKKTSVQIYNKHDNRGKRTCIIGK